MPSEGVTSVKIWLSGGKGGDGNGQGGGEYGDGNYAGHSGCETRSQGYDYGGGVGNVGSELYLQKDAGTGPLTFVLASAGANGTATGTYRDGEASNNGKGRGGADGGGTGPGQLGNAGTGGACLLYTSPSPRD